MLKLLYASVLKENVDIEPRTRLAAGLGLLRLGDKESLGVVGKLNLYENIFDALKLMFMQERNANASATAIRIERPCLPRVATANRSSTPTRD